MADIAYFLAENANSTSKNHRTFAPENKIKEKITF